MRPDPKGTFARESRVCGLSTKTEGELFEITNPALNRQVCMEKKAKD